MDWYETLSRMSASEFGELLEAARRVASEAAADADGPRREMWSRAARHLRAAAAAVSGRSGN